MPHSASPAGTIYSGKQHLRTHRGLCNRCGRDVDFVSFETQLTIAILGLPLVPIGKRFVLDYCAICGDRRVLTLVEWKKEGATAVAEAESALSELPDDPETAMRAHTALHVFTRRRGDVRMLADKMATRFADVCRVQLYLGGYYESEGLIPQAESCYSQAITLEPDNPDAKTAVAFGLIRQGDLESAQQLLDSVEPTAFVLNDLSLAAPFSPIRARFELGRALQARNLHEDALAVLGALCLAYPAVAAHDKQFRHTVKQSEKLLNRKKTLLPCGRMYVPVLAVLGVALAVVLAALGYILYLRTHQTLYVVNPFPVPATVAIAGVAEATVAQQSVQPLTIGEGRYTVTVQAGQGFADKVNIDIRNLLSERLKRNGLFVLNVGGGAVLKWEQLDYPRVPAGTDRAPHRINTTERFLTFRDIDFPFAAFPEKLPSAPDGTVTKTRLGFLGLAPEVMFELLCAEPIPQEWVPQYAEVHLLVSPGNEPLLRHYTAFSQAHGYEERCLTFLKQRIGDRPLRTEWHHAYQDLHLLAEPDFDLVSEYDALIGAFPDDAVALYLRGRIDVESADAARYYNRALEADPASPYPLFGWATVYAGRGELIKARQVCDKAHQLAPAVSCIRTMLFELRYALGEYDALEGELTTRVAERPLDAQLLVQLMQVRIARSDFAGAEQARREYLHVLKSQAGYDPKEAGLLSRVWLSYFRKDFSSYRRAAKALRDEQTRSTALIDGYLEQLKVRQAEECVSDITQVRDPYRCLVFGLAWMLGGTDEKTETWFERAVSRFRTGPPRHKRVAGLLTDPPENARLSTILRALNLSHRELAILHVALALRHPDQRTDLLRAAERLNFTTVPPHDLLALAIVHLGR